MIHGNSNQSHRPQHLYEIRDKQEDTVFKYGISDNPIDIDGLSKRIRNQLIILNLAVGWERYYGLVLHQDIEGREAARKLEKQYIEAYQEKYGLKPRGNRQ